MRLLIVCLSALAVASASVGVELNYHQNVGIPLATTIKATEDEIIKRQAQNAAVSDDLLEKWNEDGKIVGGAIAPTNAYPYLAGLVITFVNIAGTSACGSSLLSSNRLVTAAHCWRDTQNQAAQFIVVLGSHYLFYGGTRITTNQVVMHPQWTPAMIANDVAVIYLPTHVWFSQQIQPVALPHSSLWDSFDGRWALAAGYGKTSDAQAGISVNSVVSHVNLQVISVPQCQVSFPFNALWSNVCTSGLGGVGICGGDSGGPLVVYEHGQPVLVGISSFVALNNCQGQHPSAFARVTSFYSFIMQHM